MPATFYSAAKTYAAWGDSYTICEWVNEIRFPLYILAYINIRGSPP